MPLPIEDQAWPPPAYQPAFDSMAEWDLWYRGDANDLEDHYRSHSADRAKVRPSQMDGGLVGTLARLFWGRPVPEGQSRTKIHVPLASDLATLSSDMLFSEPPTLRVPDGMGDKVQERLTLIFDDPATQAELIEGAELSAALSGVYLRAVWDRDLAPHPLPDAVAPDQAIPEWKFGRLSAVTFWEVLAKVKGGTWVRHIERHEPGKIIHAVYVGKQDNLGKKGELGAYQQTEWAKDLPDGVVLTGIEQLTAVYIPNIRPQRLWRGVPELNPMGRSDYVSLSTFDAIDEAMSSWMRDLRLGKGRVFIPEALLESAGEGKGGVFDPDREIYAPYAGLGRSDGSSEITPHQFEIRWEEHQKTIQQLIRTACRSAGLSPASWGDDSISEGAQTATGVKANTALTQSTRDKKSMYWRAGLSQFARMLLNLDAAQFSGGAAMGDELPDVHFSSNPNQDSREMAETAQMLRAADAASTETLVRLVNPDWDDEEVEKEVAKIEDEKEAAKPEPLADPFGDRPGGADPEMDPDDPQNPANLPPAVSRGADA